MMNKKKTPSILEYKVRIQELENKLIDLKEKNIIVTEDKLFEELFKVWCYTKGDGNVPLNLARYCRALKNENTADFFEKQASGKHEG